jgi:hypothetical protein
VILLRYTKYILVLDSSPWIDYKGTWVDKSDANQTAGYVNSSFHYTQAANAAAVIAFNRTGMHPVTSISSVYEHTRTPQAQRCTVQSELIMETTSSVSTRTCQPSRALLQILNSSIRPCSTSRSSHPDLTQSRSLTPRHRPLWIWIMRSLRSEMVTQSESCAHVFP